ncbi:MAG: phosphopantothenate/pantothenate synthetase [Candidatus Latescibacteria bacterium]|nr:phosphopantothenate/pantothenate synthetase [Candidatus Latescibacterota bacterium]
MSAEVPHSHPRYASLRLREAIVAGVEKGITSVHGLIAHGRGEALDYLIGEATQPFALEAARAGAALLLGARHPVISVNGNAAALVPAELAALGRLLPAPLEVNIFHTSAAREQAIRAELLAHGAPEVLMPTREAQLSYIESNRRFVHPEGILRADVVFVPLEDGDRCQALRRMGKEVVTVDLNPLSRTAHTASVTIVDNIARALPLMLELVAQLQQESAAARDALITAYDHHRVLRAAEARIRSGA